MFDSRLDYPNEFPTLLTAPDISPYKNGNGCADYIHSFVGAATGPHVVISAVVHGNEICGAIALDWLFRQDPRPRRGTLSLAFMNVDAYLAFDPRRANLTRWLEEDFNRVWGALDDASRPLTVESRRARAVRPLLDSADLLLDLHSMQTPCPPLLLTGEHAKGRVLARRIGGGLPALVDAGHAEGKRMRDYAGFGDAADAKNAVLAECGQNWEESAADVAKEIVVRFLRGCGVMAADFGLDLLAGLRREEEEAQAFYEVGEVVTVATDDFRFARTWMGFEHLPKGTLIGRDGDREIIAPYAPTILIMPSRQLFIGKTAARLAFRRAKDD